MGFTTIFACLRPAYEIPDDDLVGEVLVPAMQASDEVRLGVGFFSSKCLAQIAPGLAAFVNGTQSTLDLMVSPELSEEDLVAIERGLREPTEVIERAIEKLIDDAGLSASAIERHTVDTLAYLVASRRLRMRVVIMRRGMYHKKIWLFRSGPDWLAVHGSGNATERGLLVNGEQMSIDRAWLDGQQSSERVNIFLEQWQKQWENRSSSSFTVSVDGVLNVLKGRAPTTPPTLADFWKAWEEDYANGRELTKPRFTIKEELSNQLSIPHSLQWREGRFAHQEKAVEAILEHDGGILAIATGGGKTKTALIATTQFQDREGGHFCIVVLAPTKPLVRQWATEVRGFGVEPIVLSGMNVRDRQQQLEHIALAFSANKPRTVVLILTNSLFTARNSFERRWLEALPASVTQLLIADEVHNLGAKSFIEYLPEFFRFRIGLSATPIRQYDPDGTNELFGFFRGEPRFEFSLRDAIRSGCLVPYRYFLHPVAFNSDEMEAYEELTARLIQLGFRVDDEGRTMGLTTRVAAVLRDRRALVENAAGKISCLESELARLGSANVTRTLVYASAKPAPRGRPKQITEVNRLLNRLDIIAHQYTHSETTSADARNVLGRFETGDYQALTCMKVLDEGVDLPLTHTAYLLASSAVEREWVQRRGRILRQAQGKKNAQLHDFIVVPPSFESAASQAMLRSELRRAAAFAELAENQYDAKGGPMPLIRQLENEIWGQSNG